MGAWSLGLALWFGILGLSAIFRWPWFVLFSASVLLVFLQIVFVLANHVLLSTVLGTVAGGTGLMFLVYSVTALRDPSLLQDGSYAAGGVAWLVIILTFGFVIYSRIAESEWGRRRRGYLTIADIVISLTDATHPNRAAATQLLAQVGQYQAVKPLLQATADPDPAVREIATLQLIDLLTERELTKRLHTQAPTPFLSPDATVIMTPLEERVVALMFCISVTQDEVQKRALQFLTNLGAAVGPILVEFLNEPDDGELRAAAAKVLGMLNQQDAVPALIAVLKDEVSEVRFEAATALGVLSNPQALEPLEHLQQDAGWRSETRQVRQAVQTAIKKIRARQQNL